MSAKLRSEIVLGIINLYKPAGKTSHDMVSFVRKTLGIKKVGHTGTLDPCAEGVLPILVGRATALSDYLMAGDKIYTATVKLGIITDTYDTTGTILKENTPCVSLSDIKKAAAKFIGEIQQEPPMYSAIKIGGRKLYQLAREGKEIERPKRNITIFDISVLNFDEEKNELVKKYFLRYLNVVKFCPIGTTGCFPNQAYTGLNGTASHTYGDGKNPTALLADGTSINFAIFPNYYSNNKKTLAMDIDTNGFRKPNVIGRDMFAINIYPATGELLPHGINNDGSSLNENGDYEKYTLDEIINTGGAHACNPNNLGWFCGARIILEGFKMNY